ncbi:MAG: hypothetical protein Q8K42_09165, partial [Methylobacter sp.]|nr:hypothetical protein [Methylobacter sp.]
LIQAVSQQLLPQYPGMNPRLLDYLIWSWQSGQSDAKNYPLVHQGKTEFHETRLKPIKKILPAPRKKILTIPQKTQLAMHRRYRSGQLISSSQIKDDVLADYPDTPRSSVIPRDYCCNVWNLDPASGIYHVFFFEENQYRLLPELELTVPRQRGQCP